MTRFFQSYLINYAFFLSIGLGGLFFVTLQHLTRAGWSVAVRRIAEGIAQSLQLMALLFVPIALFAMPELYLWARPAALEHDHLVQHKAPYLNLRFFVIRWVIYFAIWLIYSRYFFRASVRQDETGDKQLTVGMQKHSTHGMVLFALSLTFAAFDLLMSLDPHWFSTIFGVYFFAGSALAIFSTMALTMFLLQASGRLRDAITAEHYHDVGKLMFGFIVFWAYIAFSQYMLIWVADIPEETGWILRRQTGQWAIVSVLLIVGHFVFPFLALISRRPKRRAGVLAAMAVWILAMHWVDIYWQAMPEFAEPGHAPLNMLDLGLLLGIGGLFVAYTAFALRHCSLVAERDPLLGESLALDNA